jgi:hypothetical protein
MEKKYTATEAIPSDMTMQLNDTINQSNNGVTTQINSQETDQ